MHRSLPICFALLLGLALAGSPAAQAAPVRTEHVEAELRAEHATVGAGQARHRGPAAEDGRALAHLLEESGRLGPAHEDPLDAARRLERRPVPVALPRGPARGPAHELRLLGRGDAPRRAHAARRREARPRHHQGRRRLAGLQGHLHPREGHAHARPRGGRGRVPAPRAATPLFAKARARLPVAAGGWTSRGHDLGRQAHAARPAAGGRRRPGEGGLLPASREFHRPPRAAGPHARRQRLPPRREAHGARGGRHRECRRRARRRKLLAGIARPQGGGTRAARRRNASRGRGTRGRPGRRSGRQPRPRARVRAGRRAPAQPHALRLPRARHQGDGLRAACPRGRARAVAAGRGLLGRRARLVPRPRGAAARPALGRDGARAGASSCSRPRS